MKIVGIEELIKMPKGTIFAEYTDYVTLSHIMSKTVQPDFIAINVEPDLQTGEINVWDWSARENDEDTQFIVYEEKDIRQMISVLERGLGKNLHMGSFDELENDERSKQK